MLLLLWAAFIVSVADSAIEKEIIGGLLDRYDARIRPSGGQNGTGPVIIEVNTYLRAVNNIDEKKMLIEVQLTFRQAWLDDRLKYTSHDLKYISLTNPATIWTPDLFFTNEDSGHFHNMLKPNVLIRIYPEGKVLYSTRVSLCLFCPMNFLKYPFDSQYCSIKAASYAYTTEDITLAWKDTDPVQVNKVLFEDYNTKFKLVSIDTNHCNSKTSTGDYSCLKVDLHLIRNFFYLVAKVYVPTTAMLLLSWAVFWIHPKYSTIRFVVSVGALVCGLLITSSVGNRAPQVSHATAMDEWIGICVCFYFWSIFECFWVVNTFSKNERLLSSKKPIEEKRNILSEEIGRAEAHGSFPLNPLKWLDRSATRAPRIDAFSRLIFPLAFALFNLFYWLKYKAF